MGMKADFKSLTENTAAKVYISQDCRQQLCLNHQPATAQKGSSSSLRTALKSFW